MSKPDMPGRINDMLHILQGLSPDDIAAAGHAIVVHGVHLSANISSNTDARQIAYENVLRAASLHNAYCELTAPECDEVLQ